MHIPLQVKPSPSTGFTLIEISIVLVIIGLLIGSILTGQDLINTAAIRSQISQIEKYNTAVNTFRGKYGYLPGDIPDPAATQFGFQPRGTYQGEGDGDGILAGDCANSAGSYAFFDQGCGEPAVFWEDLSTAGLIDVTIFGHDSKGAHYPWTAGQSGMTITLSTSPAIKDWLPAGKIGQNNYIYVFSKGGINYFAVSSVTQIGSPIYSTADPGLTVQQAYNIDSKIDDSLPLSGNVTTCYMNFNVGNNEYVYAAGSLLKGANSGVTGSGSSGSPYSRCNPTTAATATATTDCYGNNNTAGTMQYSLSQNANVQNCALSFKFQ